MSRADANRDAASVHIARRLAEDPQVSANTLYRELREHGIGARRQWVLQEVREFADSIGITGRAEHRYPQKFAPVRETKYADAVDVVNLARRKRISIARARKDFNRMNPHKPISTGAVKRHAGKALEKRGGIWHAKPRDTLSRNMTVVTQTGVKRLTVRESRTASRIGEYMAAVNRYFQTGDERVLYRFRGKRFRVNKTGYWFETDPSRLEDLELVGELDAIETVSG